MIENKFLYRINKLNDTIIVMGKPRTLPEVIVHQTD